jgi:hypothetical protein
MDPQTNATASAWPGAFGIFKRAKAATLVNGWTLFGLDVLAVIVSVLQQKGDKNNNGTWVVAFVASLLSVFVQLVLTAAYLASARGEKISFGDSLKAGVKHYINGFIASIVVVVLLAISLLALVVPFFFVLPRLTLVFYFLVDQNLGPIEAIKASWDQTKGYSTKVWGVIAVSFLFAVLGLVLVGIYLSFVYQTAFALLYLHLGGKLSADKPAEVKAAPVE